VGPEIAIAVVGMAGRFPGAQNVEEFWTNVKQAIRPT
jgi:acyl transferase domain-containing protein